MKEYLRYIVNNPTEIYGNFNRLHFSDLKKAELALKPGGFILDIMEKFDDSSLSNKIVKTA